MIFAQCYGTSGQYTYLLKCINVLIYWMEFHSFFYLAWEFFKKGGSFMRGRVPILQKGKWTYFCSRKQKSSTQENCPDTKS